MKTSTEVHFTGIIPARFASTRFPGKPLAIIGDKPMIQHVYERASNVLESVFVATDDTRIQETVEGFGGRVLMTSVHHRSGTDRCAEAALIIENQYGRKPGVVINIQGDEPFIETEQIRLLTECFEDKSVEIATLIRKVGHDEDLFNANHPKVAVAKNNDAIYFSRSVIPYFRDAETSLWQVKHTYYKHIGIYGYRSDTLLRITALPQGSLELAESLEQNRWLENGFRIRTAVTPWESIGIDTPADLEKAREFYIKHYKI
jgi:3-deoxy-manno-octulosonate cytidylyltransferase (CMP-KDO synthetase)